jgi:hypothetical protein
MNLTTWLSKTPAARNRFRRRWVEHDLVRFAPLLEEARQRFETEFGSHPQVLRVEATLARDEPCIEVVTELSRPERIEELPDRYCSFFVYQWQLLTEKGERLAYWRLVLRNVAGWRPARIKRWAAQHSECLDGGSPLFSVFWHRAAADYVSQALIPEEFKGSKRYWKIRNELWAALERPPSGNHVFPAPSDSHYDWNAARARVKKVLSKYGHRL